MKQRPSINYQFEKQFKTKTIKTDTSCERTYFIFIHLFYALFLNLDDKLDYAKYAIALRPIILFSFLFQINNVIIHIEVVQMLIYLLQYYYTQFTSYIPQVQIN